MSQQKEGTGTTWRALRRNVFCRVCIESKWSKKLENTKLWKEFEEITHKGMYKKSLSWLHSNDTTSWLQRYLNLIAVALCLIIRTLNNILPLFCRKVYSDLMFSVLCTIFSTGCVCESFLTLHAVSCISPNWNITATIRHATSPARGRTRQIWHRRRNWTTNHTRTGRETAVEEEAAATSTFRQLKGGLEENKEAWIIHERTKSVSRS